MNSHNQVLHLIYVLVLSSSYHPQHMCPFPVLQSDLYELSQPGTRLYKFNIFDNKIGPGVYIFDIKESASMEK